MSAYFLNTPRIKDISWCRPLDSLNLITKCFSVRDAKMEHSTQANDEHKCYLQFYYLIISLGVSFYKFLSIRSFR